MGTALELPPDELEAGVADDVFEAAPAPTDVVVLDGELVEVAEELSEDDDEVEELKVSKILLVEEEAEVGVALGLGYVPDWPMTVTVYGCPVKLMT